MTKLEQHQFVSRLNSIEKYAVANKVHFVSSLINRNNRLRNNEVAISIVTESLRADVDPLLIAAIIKSESTFKVNAVSVKGARGLMQLMPDTARFAEARLLKPDWQRVGTDIHKIDYNISLGISYLKHLEDSFNGNRELALIAYNWGPGNLKNALKNKSHIPESTKSYARKIIRTHQRWQGEMKVLALVGSQEQPRKIPT
jgi:soluble lytic murein transglycosylase-like protein